MWPLVSSPRHTIYLERVAALERTPTKMQCLRIKKNQAACRRVADPLRIIVTSLNRRHFLVNKEVSFTSAPGVQQLVGARQNDSRGTIGRNVR
jgi:hypothetical protein